MNSQIILLVEDEVLIRMLLAETLRDNGYCVIEAATGDEGLQILLSGQTVTALVTDVSMPGMMDGIALATHSKRATPCRPVIILSSHLSAVDATVADAFIAKPCAAATVFSAIDKLIGQPCHQSRIRTAS